MNTRESISKEIDTLYGEGAKIATELHDGNEDQNFTFEYQGWYTKALKVVDTLARDRLQEFKSYYEIDPKRKAMGYGTYHIQDYLKGVVPSRSRIPGFDSRYETAKNMTNQLSIVQSLSGRIDSILANINIELLAEIQDAELETARKLIKVSLRAAGSLAGVIIENHLQKLANKHDIPLKKKNPTISDLNDPLKGAGIFDIPTWRKITYFGDIRNICCHKKDIEPTKEQVNELIEGANWLIKNTF